MVQELTMDLLHKRVSSSLSIVGKTSTDLGLITGSQDPTEYPIETRGGTWGLRYGEFISPMIKIQELSAEVKQLKLQISGSNG